jgi:hypothetical protein
MYNITDSSHFNMDNFPFDIPKVVFDPEDWYEINGQGNDETITKCYKEGSSDLFDALQFGHYFFLQLDDNNNPVKFMYNYGD